MEMVKTQPDKTLEDLICTYKIMAEEQRKTGLQYFKTTRGVEGYEKIGCYECSGHNTKCQYYFNLKAKL